VSLGLLLAPAVATAALAQSNDASAPLRAQINGLGLTPDQLRQRLQSSGYDPKLLDSYLSGTEVPVAPSPSALKAVEALSRSVEEERRRNSELLAARPAGLASAPVTIDGDPVFGLDVFRTGSSRFEPAVAGPVDGGYKLGAGDVLAILLTGAVELAHTLEVSREGFVVVPQVGQVFVNSLTLDQATRVLQQRLSRSYAGVGTGPGAATQLFVSVARLRTNQIFVLGDVVQPGSYQVPAAGTMLTALYAAGGPTVNGSLRQVLLRRRGEVVATLDAYDYLVRGDASHDVRLEQGDVLFVPRHQRRVLLGGAIGRPGWYEAKAGESVADVIEAGGGFAASAARERLLVQRILPPAARRDGQERAAFDVKGTQLAVFPVEDGDRITIPTVTARVRNRIAVAGHVWRPGPQGIAPGATLATALAAAGGVKPGFVAEEVTILRRRDDDTHEQVSASLHPETGRPSRDVLLQEDDSIHVWSRADFRPRIASGRDTLEARRVTVGGAVMRPGALPWVAGLTLRQAILRSGGLDESALLTEVEVARMPTDRRNGEQAIVMRVPIDSSFLFERRAGGSADADGGPEGSGPDAAERGTRNSPAFVLEPYDVINVLRQPDFEYLGTVTLSGEVRYPGQYAIRRKGERLSDLIARAGGLTAEAYADGAVFTRRLDEEERAERRRLLTQVRLGAATTSLAVATMEGGTAAPSADAALRYREAMDAFLQQDGDAADRLNIDLPRVLRSAAHRDNVEVQPGDALTVPRFSPTVAVKGFVHAPSAVAHVPGRPLSYYVARAGGAAGNGEARRSFVVQPNGAVETIARRPWLLPDRDPVPKPGAIVVVPPRDASDRRPNLVQVLGPVTQVLASVVAIIAVSRR
jgi:protein involved in polysaccharide export with SLBB domain